MRRELLQILGVAIGVVGGSLAIFLFAVWLFEHGTCFVR